MPPVWLFSAFSCRRLFNEKREARISRSNCTTCQQDRKTFNQYWKKTRLFRVPPTFAMTSVGGLDVLDCCLGAVARTHAVWLGRPSSECKAPTYALGILVQGYTCCSFKIVALLSPCLMLMQTSEVIAHIQCIKTNNGLMISVRQCRQVPPYYMHHQRLI
jgi:hypothetical protein